MKLPVVLMAVAAAISCQAVMATETLKAAPEYCLFITVDGLDRDYVARGDAPTLRALQDAGTSFPDAICVWPTLTTPNMTSLVTGAYPITTGIGANTVFLKDEKKVVPGPRFNKAETIAEVFKAGGHPTAAVQHFMLESRGADRYARVMDANSENITTQAIEFLREKPTPRLLGVLYQTLDKKGHLYGADSTTVSEECRMIDGEIKKIIDVYRELGILDRTIITVNSDHGMSNQNKLIDRKALNDALAKGGWSHQQLTDKVKPGDAADFYYISLGNMNGYFNRSFSEDEKQKLFNTFRSIEGIGTIYDETMLRRLQAHPNAGDFMVEPAAGYWFGGGGGSHGRMTESDSYVTISGAGIKPGSVAVNAETVDVVPTVLQAMGMPIPKTTDGKVLWESLD